MSDFETPLGIIRSWYEVLPNRSWHEYPPNLFRIQTDAEVKQAYKITLLEPDLGRDHLDDMPVEISRAWLWHVEKIHETSSRVRLCCQLTNPSSQTQVDTAGGQHLIAIMLQDNAYQVHIGTEDEEVLEVRAAASDQIPKRLGELEGAGAQVSLSPYGLQIDLPALDVGETMTLHFVAAGNPIMMSKEYPDEEDASTWFAVDIGNEALRRKAGLET